MPFDVQGARNAGYNDAEIVEHLAVGNPNFDLAGARSAGYDDAEILGHLLSGPAPASQAADTDVSGGPDADILGARRALEARQRAELETKLHPYDPAAGQGVGQNLRAGAGKVFADVGRGVRQMGASVADAVAPREQTLADLAGGRDHSRRAAVDAEVTDSRRLDAPLMRTGSGVTGNVLGNLALTAPALMVPGGATLPGAAATGAAYGAVQPVAGDESRAGNIALGGGLGAAGPIAARTVGALWRTGKGLAEPFTHGGRERIAGRVLEKYGVEPGDLAGLTDAPTRTGARLTAAEQIQRPEGAAGMARLQDNIRAQSPEVSARMESREMANNAARVGRLESMENMNGGRAMAEELRQSTAKTLYEKSFEGAIDPKILTAAERGEMTKVMNLPSVQDAMRQATKNLRDKGFSQKLPQNSIRVMHEAKLAMDDVISEFSGAGATAAQVNKAHAIKMARDRLVTFMERHSPGENYKYARQFYAEQSVPINQADIAGEVLKRGGTTTSDLAGNTRLTASGLTRAVADEAKLIKNATGRDLGGDLSKVMTKDQLADIRAVVGEVDRAAAVARAGNGPGSGTAQRLAGTNVLDSALKETGLPKSWSDSTLLQTILARPIQWISGGLKGPAEQRIQATLGDIILNPSLANKAMMAANPAQRTALANVMRNKYLMQAARQTLPAMATANRQ